ncbi:radical SAM protein [Candidatus Omnitrophota bacterium]
MTYKFRKISSGLLRNILINAVKRRFTANAFFRPILPTLFITLRCNLNCSYCGLIKKRTKELSTEDTFRLLGKIRPHNAALSISGGEPLVRADITEVLKKAKELGFAPVFLNTNALLIHEKEEVLKYVDYLIVSLDSLNENKWDRILGVEGASKTISGNIKTCSKLQKKYGFKMIINSVITPETIPDIYEVMNLCREHDLLVSPVPEDQWSSVNAGLANNPGYYRLIEDIIAMKKGGNKNIILSDVFLDQIIKFEKHNCFPTLVPRIYPDGSVFYPCTPVGNVHGNLLDYPNLNTMLKRAYKKEKLPECVSGTKKCFMSCFMEPANIIEHPFSLLKQQLKHINR